jgi:hypothetical protein
LGRAVPTLGSVVAEAQKRGYAAGTKTFERPQAAELLLDRPSTSMAEAAV